MDLNLDFIAGFIDADGSFLLGLEKSQGNKFGYTPKLVLDITNTDLFVLKKVKDTLGFGRIVKTSATTYAYRTNTHKDAERLIQIFENRFHGSAQIEMPLWEQAFSLVKQKETTHPQGLSKFVHLMYGINSKGRQRKKTLENWLKEFKCEYQPDYLQNVRSSYASLLGKELKEEYISGYCQGDGSFSLSNGKRFQASFSLTDADRTVLDQISAYFGLGTHSVFAFYPKTSENNKVCYRLQLTRFQSCHEIIIPHFDKFPLYNSQEKRYQLWRQAIVLQDSKFKYPKLEYNNEINSICKRLSDLKEK